LAEALGKPVRWGMRAGERRLLLILGDLIAATLAMLVAVWLWGKLDYLGPTAEFLRTRAPWFIFLPVAWLFLVVNLYDVRRAGSGRETLRGVLIAAGSGLAVYMLLFFFRSEGSLPRRGVLYFLFLSTTFTLLWRMFYLRVFTTPAFMRRVLVVGAGETGKTLLDSIQDLRPAPFHIVGLVDDDPAKHGSSIHGIPVLGGGADLLSLAGRESISDIVVAILGPMNGEMFQALLDAQQRGVEIIRMPVVYEELLGRVPIRHLESDWLLRSFVDELRVSSLYLMVKRSLDLIGATVGLITLGLLFPWVSLAICLEDGRPVLHGQTRLGQGGRPYVLTKFRTMRRDAEADGTARWTNGADPRTTRVGRFLRRTHLDEFPQFWNVLTGDMSLVGPRPERPELVAGLEKQIPFYRARLLVKPGIGGWAQVNYGKGASIEGSAEKLEYDLYYIQHRSLWMDVSIILRSIGQAAGLRGV
jgi:exopolysaccharide biosynthesis polyprenyl glycosylphosphotransferase